MLNSCEFSSLLCASASANANFNPLIIRDSFHNTKSYSSLGVVAPSGFSVLWNKTLTNKTLRLTRSEINNAANSARNNAANSSSLSSEDDDDEYEIEKFVRMETLSFRNPQPGNIRKPKPSSEAASHFHDEEFSNSELLNDGRITQFGSNPSPTSYDPLFVLEEDFETEMDFRGKRGSRGFEISGDAVGFSQQRSATSAIDDLLTRPTRPPEDIFGSEGEEEEEGGRVPAFLSYSENHKSGYVALVGAPNAGKSTLLNAIIGQKLSIVTRRPQTTRHRILGICSGQDYQIILYDTPGVISKHLHYLDEVMMGNVRAAAVSADCIVVVVDVTLQPMQIESLMKDELHLSAFGKNKSILVLLNKADRLRPGELRKKKEWYEANCGGLEVMCVSAQYGKGVEELKNWMLQKLPPGPAYYPKDIVSEHPERFFVSEIMREKMLLQYNQEIPYAAQVNVTKYIERYGAAKDFIAIEIVVERESQKAIVLGKSGLALKALASTARKDIEEFVGREVFLEIQVRVKEKWRSNEKMVQSFGIDSRKQR